ncbi:hypothetical protein ACNQ1N_01725 [Mycoplasma sp. HF11B]|uniref:hypothetical protein n=1 Tax=unclassified Mycoplasma TaxID=2683645 RepID=UPI003AACDE4D
MKIKLKHLIKCSVGALSAIPIAAGISCKNSYDEKLDDSDKDQIVKTDHKLKYKAFINDIVDSAQNPYPSIFIGRNASQYLISSSYAMLGQLEIAHNQKENNLYNDVIYIIDTVVNDYQKTLKNEEQRFNYNVVLNKYGDSAIKDKNNTLNVEQGSLRVINNSAIFENNNSAYEYSVFPRSKAELLSYLAGYLDKVQLFDFYIPDISFIDLSYDTIEWMIAHANKIVILSDGNAQPYKFIRDNYFPWVDKQSAGYSQEQLLEFWNRTHETQRLQIDYHYFYTLKDKFKIYNSVSDYAKYFNKLFEKNNKEWAQLEINDYPLSFSTLAQELSPYINKEEFLNTYLQLVNLNNKTVLDLVTKGKENYDPKKKNLVFIGSSLFRYEGDFLPLTVDLPKTLEFKSYINKIFELYPPEKYNYFYKLHPVFKKQQADEFVKVLTQERDKSAIILDSSISWENMLALDFAQIKNGRSIFFDKDSFVKDENVKTKLFGIQASTTTLLTTIAMLREYFNIDLQQALLFVDPNNFPLPGTFNIVDRNTTYNNKETGYNANLNELEKIYRFFIYSGDFPKLSNFKPMSEFLNSLNK